MAGIFGQGGSAGLQGGLSQVNGFSQQMLQIMMAAKQQEQAQQARLQELELRREQLAADNAARSRQLDMQEQNSALQQQLINLKYFEAGLNPKTGKPWVKDNASSGGESNSGGGAVFGGPAPLDQEAGPIQRSAHGVQGALAGLGQGLGKDIYAGARGLGLSDEDIANASSSELVSLIAGTIGEKYGGNGSAANDINKGITGAVESVTPYRSGELLDIASQGLGSILNLPTEAPRGIIQRGARIQLPGGKELFEEDPMKVRDIQVIMKSGRPKEEQRMAIAKILGLPEDARFNVSIQENS